MGKNHSKTNTYIYTYIYVLFSVQMNRGILEFKLNNKKVNYFRRLDVYGKPIITTIKNNAKIIKETNVKDIIKALLITYGKNNINNTKFIKME